MWRCSSSEFLSDVKQQNVIMFLLSFSTVCYGWQTDSVNVYKCWCLQRNVWLRTFATTATWRLAMCPWPAKMMRSCIGSCLKLWTSWASARKNSLVSTEYSECSMWGLVMKCHPLWKSCAQAAHRHLCFLCHLVCYNTRLLVVSQSLDFWVFSVLGTWTCDELAVKYCSWRDDDSNPYSHKQNCWMKIEI